MKLAVLVFILFVNGEPVKGGSALTPMMEVCKAEAESLKEKAKERGADVWAQCVEVDHDLKPQSLPFGPAPRGGNA